MAVTVASMFLVVILQEMFCLCIFFAYFLIGFNVVEISEFLYCFKT
jgi:hypothetical protein